MLYGLQLTYPWGILYYNHYRSVGGRSFLKFAQCTVAAYVDLLVDVVQELFVVVEAIGL